MSDSTFRFAATGTIQTFLVPASGTYVLEAAGAQGGPGSSPGGRGARIKGTFYFRAGDVLQIVIGRQGGAGISANQPCGGGGGGSFVWHASVHWPLPAQPLLAAGGGGGGGESAGGPGLADADGGAGAAPGGRHGHGGESDGGNFHYSGGGGAGWLSGGDVGSTPTLCGGGTLWRGGSGADYCGHRGGGGGFGGGGGGSFLGQGSGGGGGYSGGGGGTQAGPAGGGGGSFNLGAFPVNLPDLQSGDGYLLITAVPAPVRPAPGSRDPFGALHHPPFHRDAAESVDFVAHAERGIAGRGFM